MKKIPVYKFYKHKYGDELLVDVISYEKMMPDIRRTPVFSETFYSITLVLDGDTSVAINGRLRKLERGLIICSIPGEVWSFEDNPQLDALNLVFEKEFLLSFFSDPHFLDRFTYLQADRSSPFLMADDAAFERIHTLYQEMRDNGLCPERPAHPAGHALRNDDASATGADGGCRASGDRSAQSDGHPLEPLCGRLRTTRK